MPAVPSWSRLPAGDVAIDVEHRGFDRLREAGACLASRTVGVANIAAGFSAEDVDEMRMQFHAARPYLSNAGAMQSSARRQSCTHSETQVQMPPPFIVWKRSGSRPTSRT